MEFLAAPNAPSDDWCVRDPGSDVLKDSLIEPFKGILDEEAIAALGSIDRSQVESILKGFKAKEAQLQNPSSWISRAVAMKVGRVRAHERGTDLINGKKWNYRRNKRLQKNNWSGTDEEEPGLPSTVKAASLPDWTAHALSPDCTPCRTDWHQETLLVPTLVGRTGGSTTPPSDMPEQAHRADRYPAMCATPGCSRPRQYEDGCDWDRCCKSCLSTDGQRHDSGCKVPAG